jgi:hypothetical protein
MVELKESGTTEDDGATGAEYRPADSAGALDAERRSRLGDAGGDRTTVVGTTAVVGAAAAAATTIVAGASRRAGDAGMDAGERKAAGSGVGKSTSPWRQRR